jgi:hypothetical protein
MRAASMAALCEISVLMSRNWLALVGSQCWGCDAHGCNYSTKHQFGGGCHVVSFRVSGNKTIALLSDAQKTELHSANSITRA